MLLAARAPGSISRTFSVLCMLTVNTSPITPTIDPRIMIDTISSTRVNPLSPFAGAARRPSM